MPSISQILATRFSITSGNRDINDTANLAESPERPPTTASETTTLNNIVALGRRWRLALDQFTDERANTSTAHTPPAAATSSAPASPAITPHPDGGLSFMDIHGGWNNLTKHASEMLDSVRENLPCLTLCCVSDSATRTNDAVVLNPHSNAMTPAASDLHVEPIQEEGDSSPEEAALESLPAHSHQLPAPLPIAVIPDAHHHLPGEAEFAAASALSEQAAAVLANLQYECGAVLYGRIDTFSLDACTQIRSAVLAAEMHANKVAGCLRTISNVRESIRNGVPSNNGEAVCTDALAEANECFLKMQLQAPRISAIVAFELSNPPQTDVAH